MGPLCFIPAQQSLVGHDLHEFQGGAGFGGTSAADLIHFPDGSWSDAPKCGQYFQLGIGRSWWLVAHVVRTY